MSPLMIKIMIMFILIVIFLIFLIGCYLFFKKVIRPLYIRIFMYQKVLKTMNIILESANDSNKKIDNLIKGDIVDIDLIKIAEIELNKPEKEIKKENNLSLFDKLKFWRKKNGKKTTIQPRTTGKSCGKSDTTTGSNTGSTDPGTLERRDRIAGTSDKKIDSGNAELRNISSKHTRINEKSNRYFN